MLVTFTPAFVVFITELEFIVFILPIKFLDGLVLETELRLFILVGWTLFATVLF